MAKVRDIKNEINFLTYEVISDCNTYMSMHPENKDKAIALVEEAVVLRNSLIRKVNHPEKVTSAYFNDIKKELVNGADSIFNKLRKLIK